jgi:hypothetical protein
MQLEYNSEKELLIIPEYGRHIQEMINYAKEIEKLEERQHFIEQIVHLMMQMNPNSANTTDYKITLWKHVFRIADYELEGIVPTVGDIPKPEDARLRPENVEYQKGIQNYRHYGKYIRALIDKALAMEDVEQRNEFLKIIGSYMKMAYRNWNREHFVSDEIVLGDLKVLIDGRCELPEDLALDFLKGSGLRPKRRKPESRSNNNRGRKQYRKHRK